MWSVLEGRVQHPRSGRTKMCRRRVWEGIILREPGASYLVDSRRWSEKDAGHLYSHSSTIHSSLTSCRNYSDMTNEIKFCEFSQSSSSQLCIIIFSMELLKIPVSTPDQLSQNLWGQSWTQLFRYALQCKSLSQEPLKSRVMYRIKRSQALKSDEPGFTS